MGPTQPNGRSTPAAWGGTGIEVLGASDFVNTSLDRPGLYIVCFAAEWCPVTRRFMPRFLGFRIPPGGRLAIADITDLNSPLWDTFRIRITPSVLVFREGAVVERLDGRRFLGILGRDFERLQSTLSSAGGPVSVAPPRP